MKRILLLFATAFILSCSSDDDSNCDAQRDEINASFDNQIEWVEENTNPVDTNQINLLNEERDLRLSQVCN